MAEARVVRWAPAAPFAGSDGANKPEVRLRSHGFQFQEGIGQVQRDTIGGTK